MTMMQGPGNTPGPLLPNGGAFATSEVIPLVHQAATRKRQTAAAFADAADAAAEAKAHAKAVRANLIITLRAFGNEVTGAPIKTSAERNEWADADADVQAAELDADLKAVLKASARMAWEDADNEFQVLRTLLGMERDENKMHGQHGPG